MTKYISASLPLSVSVSLCLCLSPPRHLSLSLCLSVSLSTSPSLSLSYRITPFSDLSSHTCFPPFHYLSAPPSAVLSLIVRLFHHISLLLALRPPCQHQTLPPHHTGHTLHSGLRPFNVAILHPCVRVSVHPSVRGFIRPCVQPCSREPVGPCVRTCVQPCIHPTMHQITANCYHLYN